MKIDANGSGDVDWDEFTGFLLQVRQKCHRTLIVAVVSKHRIVEDFVKVRVPRALRVVLFFPCSYL